jgi:pimeloyl-ACP methyl ester carboxylesterase
MSDLRLNVGGTGPGVVFLHGCPSTPDCLSPIARALASAHTTIEVALPGYGASPPAQAPYDFDAVSDLIERTLVAAGHRKLSLVGYSGGAYRAFLLACRGVLDVERVVSLAGLLTLTKEEREGFQGFAAALRAGQDLHSVMAPRFVAPAYLAAHPEAARVVEGWLDAIAPGALADELEGFARCADLTERVGALRIPVAARVGALDLAVPVAKSEAIRAAVPHAVLDVVPGVAHALIVEDLAGTTAFVERALA